MTTYAMTHAEDALYNELQRVGEDVLVEFLGLGEVGFFVEPNMLIKVRPAVGTDRPFDKAQLAGQGIRLVVINEIEIYQDVRYAVSEALKGV